MRFVDLDAVTVDAFGTLAGLADPVPRLRKGLRSFGVGAPKPGPAAFLLALQALHVRPERALHVGDSESDEEGARAAGMHFAPAPLAAAVKALA